MTFKTWADRHRYLNAAITGISVAIAYTIGIAMDALGVSYGISIAVTVLLAMGLCIALVRGAWWFAEDGRSSSAQ